MDKYISQCHQCLDKLLEQKDKITEIAKILKDSFMIYIAGNGGSASTASHMVNDFQKMCGLRAVCLTDNVPVLTAWANDDCYENVFIRQIMNISLTIGAVEVFEGRPNEVILILSGSGNSENLVRLATWGRDNGKQVIALLGTDGGRLGQMRDIIKLHIDSDQMHTEDWHLILDHIICSLMRNEDG